MQAHQISIIIIGFLMSCYSISSSASTLEQEQPQESFLKPYSAVYSTVWKKGISVKIEGKQKLSKKDKGFWQFVFTANNMFASLDETSKFQVINNQIVPETYQYKSKVLGKKKSATLSFNWDKNLVRNDVKNKPWNLTIPPNTLDKLSVQLQVRLDLKLGVSNLDYLVADGGYIKNWRLERDKLETINTKVGKVSAIKVIRTDKIEKGKTTAFWFAPKLDYLLVKLEHKEDGESYRLDIDSLK